MTKGNGANRPKHSNIDSCEGKHKSDGRRDAKQRKRKENEPDEEIEMEMEREREEKGNEMK